jgi:hypothetical protein
VISNYEKGLGILIYQSLNKTRFFPDFARNTPPPFRNKVLTTFQKIMEKSATRSPQNSAKSKSLWKKVLTFKKVLTSATRCDKMGTVEGYKPPQNQINEER